MRCSTETIKHFVFISNALFALIGIGTLIYCSIAIKDAPDNERGGYSFLILVGAIVFLISFLGCSGAMKENLCLIWTYAVIMGLLIVFNVYSLATNYWLSNSESVANRVIEREWKGKNGLADYQSQLECCGKNGPEDYTKINVTIPKTCYGNDQDFESLYKTGCIETLMELYKNTGVLINGFIWCTLALEIAALVLSIFLGIHFVNQKRRQMH